MHPQDIDPAFGNWLAGLLDGEGCFAIRRNRQPWGTRYQCLVRIALRADDRATLEIIRRDTKVGSIVTCGPTRRPNHHPMLAWQACSRTACPRIVEILDAYPLRSKKARDYTIWRQAVLYERSLTPIASRGAVWTRESRWKPMERFYGELRAVRAYGAVAEVAPEPSPQLELL